MLPFVLFPRQIEYLQWRQTVRDRRANGICEKSRDMGVTWLNAADQTHRWLFEDGYKGAFGSRKEMLVDRIGDPDSIFEKIRILLRHLPKWMLPAEFDWRRHDNFLKLTNPENGSTLTGEAGDNIGRGGRSSIYDLDEAAFIERPQKVDAALSNNTDTVIYTSSANGTANLFYKKRCSYEPPLVFRFHWTEDPRKDKAWYESMCVKYDPVTVASEIDIDYHASDPDVYIPAQWVACAIALDLKPAAAACAALDVAAGGANRNVFGVRRGPVVCQIQEWRELDTTQTSFRAIELMEAADATHLAFDADGAGAGVAGTLASVPSLPFGFTPLHGSSSPSDRVWPGEERTSKEKFHNARAEWWGILHARFKATYEHTQGLRQHDESDLISIPNHPTLIAQVSQPKRKFTSSGKLLIESKEDMRSRGIESPDFADMLAYLFGQEPQAIEIKSSGIRRFGSRTRY